MEAWMDAALLKLGLFRGGMMPVNQQFEIGLRWRWEEVGGGGRSREEIAPR